jgi:hypothetical protein
MRGRALVSWLAAAGVAGAGCAAVIGLDERTFAPDGDLDSGLPARFDAGREDVLDPIVTTQDAADVDPRPFCMRATHAFCEDFDDGSVGGDWTNVDDGVGRLRLDDASFVSAPGALWAEKDDDAAAPESLVQKVINGTFTKAVMEADIMVVSSPDSGTTKTLTLLDLVFFEGSANRHLRFQHSFAKLQMVEVHYGYPDGGSGYVFNDVALASAATLIPLGQWRHVKMEVTPGAPSHGKVSIEGVVVFDQDLVETWTGDGGVEMTVGAFANYGRGGAWQVRFDNVALDPQ